MANNHKRRWSRDAARDNRRRHEWIGKQASPRERADMQAAIDWLRAKRVCRRPRKKPAASPRRADRRGHGQWSKGVSVEVKFRDRPSVARNEQFPGPGYNDIATGRAQRSARRGAKIKAAKVGRVMGATVRDRIADAIATNRRKHDARRAVIASKSARAWCRATCQ